MRHVVIIGSGMGGLATALRLRHQGFRVTVLEKQARPGGRSNVLSENGFRVDTGPTILVMKDAFEELYRSIGQDLNQRLSLVQLDPNYRIYYHDGTHLDLYSNMAQLAQEVEKVQPGSAERLFRFIGEGARKYELGMDFVDRNLRPHHRPGQPARRPALAADPRPPKSVPPGGGLLRRQRQADQGLFIPFDVPGAFAL